MTTPVQITLLNEETGVDLEIINSNMRKLAAAINTVAGTQVVSFQILPTDEQSGFLPIQGGRLQGALSVPSLSVGAADEVSPVVTQSSLARISTPGAVRQGIHVATPSNDAAVRTAVTNLIQALRESGAIADAT